MKISFKGDYALKTILELSLQYQEDPAKLVRIGDIAKRHDIPVKYLEQILLLLKGAGYVQSKRGPEGGFFLAKPPAKITLGEIIRLTEGPTSPITCVSSSSYSKCLDEKSCAFRDIFLEIKNSINKIVDTVTFEDMCKKARLKKGSDVLEYNI
jgi:Rrf2 family protein